MHDEFAARQRAITLRLQGRTVRYIGQALGRSAPLGMPTATGTP